MRSDYTGTVTALSGAAILTACACGTSGELAKLSSSYGNPSLTERLVHPGFVAVAAALIVTGLWRRARKSSYIALAGVALLGIGEVFLPTMGITPNVALTLAQTFGAFLSVAAAFFLVAAFYKAFPFQNRGNSLLALSGAAIATGCGCCEITQGVAGMWHLVAPAQAWPESSLAIYIAGTALMVGGLYRLGGVTAAVLPIIGTGLRYIFLQAAFTGITLNGVKVDFILKYPMMVLGAAITLVGFVLAYQPRTSLAALSATPEPAISGD